MALWADQTSLRSLAPVNKVVILIFTIAALLISLVIVKVNESFPRFSYNVSRLMERLFHLAP